jgi:hypothetical protein
MQKNNRKTRVAICSVVLLIAEISGCCHVNALRDREKNPEKFFCTVRVDARPVVVFSRQNNSRMRSVVGSMANVSPAAGKFQEMIKNTHPDAITKHLLQRLPAIFEKNLSWTSVGEGQSPTLHLQVVVEELQYEAKDPLSDASVTWVVRVMLVDSASDDIVWRDCIEWKSGGLGNMEVLSSLDVQATEEVVDEMVRGFSLYLAERIKEEGKGCLLGGARDGSCSPG